MHPTSKVRRCEKRVYRGSYIQPVPDLPMQFLAETICTNCTLETWLPDAVATVSASCHSFRAQHPGALGKELRLPLWYRQMCMKVCITRPSATTVALLMHIWSLQNAPGGSSPDYNKSHPNLQYEPKTDYAEINQDILRIHIYTAGIVTDEALDISNIYGLAPFSISQMHLLLQSGHCLLLRCKQILGAHHYRHD